jgi:uncharacterized membrane protein (DUF485 family)
MNTATSIKKQMAFAMILGGLVFAMSTGLVCLTMFHSSLSDYHSTPNNDMAIPSSVLFAIGGILFTFIALPVGIVAGGLTVEVLRKAREGDGKEVAKSALNRLGIFLGAFVVLSCLMTGLPLFFLAACWPFDIWMIWLILYSLHLLMYKSIDAGERAGAGFVFGGLSTFLITIGVSLLTMAIDGKIHHIDMPATDSSITLYFSAIATTIGAAVGAYLASRDKPRN